MRRIFNLILYIFRIPETILAFISGAVVSAAINIMTSPDLVCRWNYVVSALLMGLISLVLIVWTLIVKPLEIELQEEKGENEKRLLSLWADKLANHKKEKILLLGCLLLSVLLTIVIVLLIILPAYISL